MSWKRNVVTKLSEKFNFIFCLSKLVNISVLNGWHTQLIHDLFDHRNTKNHQCMWPTEEATFLPYADIYRFKRTDDPLNAPPNFVPFFPKYNAHMYQHTKLSKYRVPDYYSWSSRKSSETEMKYLLTSWRDFERSSIAKTSLLSCSIKT